MWKQFRIPHQKRSTILDNIAAFLSVFEGRRYGYELFWALKEVSFKVELGDSLGIIGRNGSGKSTLLKLIARVMKQDRGVIRTSGKVVPILELGIGFHEELTVEENALVYSVIMGLNRSDFKRRFSSILEFSELARFRDAKLKHLSSGMRVRLAFSIAVQTQADIYLVDEALAVGDIQFQKKCLEKFRESKEEGKSIVLVSQDMQMVSDFCENTLYLSNGQTKFIGATREAIERYTQDLNVTKADLEPITQG